LHLGQLLTQSYAAGLEVGKLLDGVFDLGKSLAVIEPDGAPQPRRPL
jgi:hypothetical protein